MYGFNRENIPQAYTPISWEEKLERTNRDYGVPEYPYMPGYEFSDWEQSKEHLQATYF